MDNIKDRLIQCLDKNGIDLDQDSPMIDSISFITAIVDIEQEFGIEFPDEYLTTEAMSSYEKIYDIVKILLINQGN